MDKEYNLSFNRPFLTDGTTIEIMCSFNNRWCIIKNILTRNKPFCLFPQYLETMAQLPTARIKTIMKSTAEVDTVNKEAVHTLTRATELFIKMLASEAYKDSTDKKKLDYKNLANVAYKSDRLEFLQEIVPRKITVKQYREMMAKKQQNGSEKGSSSSEGGSDSSGSSRDSESE